MVFKSKNITWLCDVIKLMILTFILATVNVLFAKLILNPKVQIQIGAELVLFPAYQVPSPLTQMSLI